MKELVGKTAVVTGSAGGIGHAIADKAVALGMNVVLADINENGLASVERALKDKGAKVLSVETDVSDFNSVQNLANAAYDTFGAVQLVFNNAGVMTPGSLVKLPMEDIKRMIDTNLWGTIYGMKVFMPRMIEGGEEGRIVNTSSLNGLLAYPAMGVYNGTKAAIISISETTFHDLAARKSKIGISVVCPGAVKKKEIGKMMGKGSASANDRISKFREQTGIFAHEVAERIFDGISQDKFWIFTQRNYYEALSDRIRVMTKEETPEFKLPV